MEKENLSRKISEVSNKLFEKQNEKSELEKLKIKIQTSEEKEERLEEVKRNNSPLEMDIEFLNKHIDSLNSSISELKRYESIFEEKKNELHTALREEKQAEIKKAELKKEIEVFSSQIEELRERVKKTKEIKDKLNYLAKLEDWLSNKFSNLISFIEKKVMTKLQTEFSKLFSEWFLMLVSDNFDVRLSDDFTPIIGQQDYEIEYEYLSGGERTAIALAYRLALNQIINSLLSKIKTRDIIILDEPTDGFSEAQLDKMRDVLQQLNVKQLIIVSHEQKIEGFVENLIRFKKVDGISKIEGSQ